MTTSGEAEYRSAIAGDPGEDQDQRREALARLADLDVLTAADEEEISRFQAFAAGKRERRGPSVWLRRRPVIQL